MTKRNIRIREVRREEIDLQKLAHALLRLARERLAEGVAKADSADISENDGD